MKTVFAASALLLFFSCGKNAKDSGSDSVITGGQQYGIQRLMKYYPLDTVDAKGNPVRIYHTIPDVQLIAQNGKPFSTSSLKGNVVVTNFFFASCQGICPVMNTQLARIQKVLHGVPGLKIVSYSVDPSRDSAQVLQRYAERFNADTAQWKFVTGDKKSLYDLARYGYFLPVQPGNGNSEDFIHSDQVVLVDRNAIIRGYYTATDSLVVDSLVKDVKLLLQEK